MSSDGIGGSLYRHIAKPAENTAIFCIILDFCMDSVSRPESYRLASEIKEKKMSCSMSDEKVLIVK